MSKRKVEIFTKPQPVEVDWVDAISRHRWDDPDTHTSLDGALVKSVGYLLQRDKKVLVLVQNQGLETGQMADSITIPASCVKRVRRLK